MTDPTRAANVNMGATSGNEYPEYAHPQPPPPYPGLPPKDNPSAPSAYPQNPPPMGFTVPQGPAVGDMTYITTSGGPTVIGSSQGNTVIVANFLSDRPTTVTCPRCGQQGVTRIDTQPSSRTHLFALLLCIFCWPCSFLPYCVDSCMNVDHYCSNCNAFVGSYQN